MDAIWDAVGSFKDRASADEDELGGPDQLEFLFEASDLADLSSDDVDFT